MAETDPEILLEAFSAAGVAVRAAVGRLSDEQKQLRTGRVGQYGLDIVADGAALKLLRPTGAAIVSEESGYSGDEHGEITIVLDPIDGSTNCARGLSYYATSIAALDADGLLCALVVNQATGVEYRAIRDGGATRDGAAIRVSEVEDVADSVVALSGLPARVLQWKQYRVLGCASLALCDLATGGIDGYIDGGSWHAPWDYLGGQLIVQEAGGLIVDTKDRDLAIADPEARRQLVAASTQTLLDVLRPAAGKR